MYKKILHLHFDKKEFFLETPGLDPEITICKIAVFPIKLCPPI